MEYSILKSLHIIFVVSYFAGLFYIVRLFIYHTETLERDNPTKRTILHQQYSFMEERLWNIITIPALIIMILSGIGLLYITNWGFLELGWMQVKLVFVVLLLAYHFWSWRTLKSLQKGIVSYTSLQLRMMNEVATLILFAVVFAVMMKGYFMTHWYWALAFFVLMGVFIMLVVKIVNRKKQ